jgi:hypothetical protein
MEPDYGKRAAFDLAARNVHPALAQDLIGALREAGLSCRGPLPVPAHMT